MSGLLPPLNLKKLYERWCSGVSKIKDRIFKTDRFSSYRKEFANNGIDGLKACIKNDLTWNNLTIQTGVIGDSGTGKSSFINSIRGINPGQPGAAKTGGNCETTRKCQSYSYPNNESFVIWDLPGIGPLNCPKETYLEKIGFDQYDFFIIVSKVRFTENDLWLAQEVQKKKKKFFFVRTHIDTAIESEKVDNPNSTRSVEDILREIRKKTEEVLSKEGIDNPMVFLLNNREKDKHDFGSLNNTMLSACDDLKRDALALSLSAVTIEVIDEKVRVLIARIPLVSLDVVSTSDKFVQKLIFREEIELYLKQFNIDDRTLAMNEGILLLKESTLEEFKVIYDSQAFDGEMSMETPTMKREMASFWARFADFFTWNKENKLLYVFCHEALSTYLEMLSKKAKGLYDIDGVKEIVVAASK